MGKEAS